MTIGHPSRRLGKSSITIPEVDRGVVIHRGRVLPARCSSNALSIKASSRPARSSASIRSSQRLSANSANQARTRATSSAESRSIAAVISSTVLIVASPPLFKRSFKYCIARAPSGRRMAWTTARKNELNPTSTHYTNAATRVPLKLLTPCREAISRIADTVLTPAASSKVRYPVCQLTAVRPPTIRGKGGVKTQFVRTMSEITESIFGMFKTSEKYTTCQYLACGVSSSSSSASRADVGRARPSNSSSRSLDWHIMHSMTGSTDRAAFTNGAPLIATIALLLIASAGVDLICRCRDTWSTRSSQTTD